MAKIFLDTNFYIDVIRRKNSIFESLRSHLLYISPFSVPIFCYLYKIKIPDTKLQKIQDHFGIVSLTKSIIDRSFEGPTNDIEDNIQLHSAAEANCNYFLTNDKSLLNMRFFGKTRIVSEL